MGLGGEISSSEESKNSPRMREFSPFRPGPCGSDISMASAAICVGASTIALGDWSLWRDGTNRRFRHAAAGLLLPADSTTEKKQLTSQSPHR